MNLYRCSKCDELVDTDYFPEYYREEYDDALICDSCMDVLEAEDDTHCVDSRPDGWGLLPATSEGGRSVKVHSTRYGLMAASCALSTGLLSIQFGYFGLFGAVFSGILCMAIVPFEQMGDK